MSSARFGLAWVVCMVWILSACSTGQVKSTIPLDLSNPGGIQINLEADGANLQTEAVMQQVSKNLAEWDYPVDVNSTMPASHLLNVQVGTAYRGSTPAGFTFSPGNSDPRALDFQKADVLPITCQLSAIKQPGASAGLNMGFSDSAITASAPDIKALADHISTVCFNLLREVNWPTKKADGEIKPGTTSWIPEIRIEEEQGAAPTPSDLAAPKSEVTAEPNKVPASQGQSNQKAQPVTKEITKEGRKVYIIHNQGNPVIFNFGFERK